MIIAKKLMLHICFFLIFWWEGGVLVIYNCRKNLFPWEHLNPPDTSNKWEGAGDAEALLCLPSTHRQVKFRVNQLLLRIIALFPPRWADKDVTSRNKRKDQRFLRLTLWLKLYSKVVLVCATKYDLLEGLLQRAMIHPKTLPAIFHVQSSSKQ